VARRAAGVVWLSFVVPYLLLHLAQSRPFRAILPVVVLTLSRSAGYGAALIEWLEWR
jgi:hypothetical protein